MKFTTSFSIARHPQPIDHSASIVLLGSCFSQHIGDRLAYYGFDTLVNPFGTLFNPYSMAVLVEKSVAQNFLPSDISGTYSYLAHSDCNGYNAASTLKNLQRAGTTLQHKLATSSHLIITLGTAWVYKLKENGSIVANCHQQPQQLFNKELLSIEDIVTALKKMEAAARVAAPDIKMIYTLSPVRHIKDGMVENTRSKSRLHEAIQQHCQQTSGYYFPAYEILMDELRDYRFYDRDMLHPNDIAVDYVWARFRESVINTSTTPAINAIEKYRKLHAHRPKNKATHEMQVKEALQKLQTKFPSIMI